MFRGDLGTVDKFRPYKAPLLGWLHELRYSEHESVAAPPEDTPPETSPVISQPADQTPAVELSVVLEEAADLDSTNSISDESEATITDSADDTWTDISELNVN